MTPASAGGEIGLLERPLERLLGKRTATALAKLDLHTGWDLLDYLPKRYETWGQLSSLDQLVADEEVTVQVQVIHAQVRRTMSGRPPAILQALVTDGLMEMEVVMFGAHYQLSNYAHQLQPDTTAIFAGKTKFRGGRLQLTGAKFQVLDELSETERQALMARPIPIYRASETLPSWRLAKAIRMVLDQLRETDVPEYVPKKILAKRHLLGLLEAYRQVHGPADSSQWVRARSRLRYNQALLTQVALASHRADVLAREHAIAWPVPKADSLRSQIDAHLPFELTASQVQVGEQIAQDLNKTVPMQRLLQGDVGAGKTVVALRAMAQVLGQGGQCALLAPTEVLAAQHVSSLKRLLSQVGPIGAAPGAKGSQGTKGAQGSGLAALPGLEVGAADKVYLLTASMSVPAKRAVLAKLASGESAIVVGTHALLSDTVQLPGLGLVVIDEQHRFGVAQRNVLRERGSLDPSGAHTTPHLLVMTATPIPRTVAMTVFGDLEISVLEGLPAGRTQVTTHLVPWERQAWVQALWRRAAQEIAGGGRVFVVCPSIDSETSDASLASVNDWAQRLAKEPELAGISIGTLTGRMDGVEKENSLSNFIQGATPLLVTTTVVEVGVDVSDATMMVILDAERFGLSQLHQLRGRVGRADKPAICMAVTGAQVGSPAFHRLKAFASTTNGFELAEADLRLRSEGDVLGSSQSGRKRNLDLLQVTDSEHVKVIEQARQDAWQIVKADPQLEQAPALAQVLARRLDEDSQAFLEKS